MRSVGIALLLVFAAPAVAAAGAPPEEAAEGDIEKYDPLMPPPVIVEEVYPDDIDRRTFVLVEGALLVPDRITLVEGQDVYFIEVVDELELERYEPVVEFRLRETMDLEYIGMNDIRLLRYEQLMWRKGLRLACREYETVGGAKVRYTAFRVSFEPCGHLYRATLTLYRSKSSLGQQVDTVNRQLGEILAALRDVRQEVSDAAKKVSAALDDVKDTVASLEGRISDLDSRVRELDKDIESLAQRIRSLERAN